MLICLERQWKNYEPGRKNIQRYTANDLAAAPLYSYLLFYHLALGDVVLCSCSDLRNQYAYEYCGTATCY